ncbi:hypothetical protein QR680_008052 [Steinernema hermaphroditum]|uniref:Uncharacterized protein n=1 Tax=Steinernema hermaphroditum TaxID=289476 RepID=A0AA39M7D9_9BILA|nr:hypothetical protein QR680_008052 [Steinernema hermaphroditum]
MYLAFVACCSRRIRQAARPIVMYTDHLDSTPIDLNCTEVLYDVEGNIVRVSDIPEGHCLVEHEFVDANGVLQHFVMMQPYADFEDATQNSSIALTPMLEEEPVLEEEPMLNFRYVRRSTRKLRKVSSVRVNPDEMDMNQLGEALMRKMIEKMGRPVPVTLVDKMHARCDICNTIVSLNKKFEVVHLVRHFNAWHPTPHKCSGTWNMFSSDDVTMARRPLSMVDFAVVHPDPDSGENLQCIYCGMLMDQGALAMHFHEVHPDEVQVPKCHLCVLELVVNARIMFKFGELFDITMADEHHFTCAKFNMVVKSERALDEGIKKRIEKLRNGEEIGLENDGEEEADESSDQFFNSRMAFGRRNKPKRHFVLPKYRQAFPIGSTMVHEVAECHWRCLRCNGDIIGAVISAAAIRHYRQHHPELVEPLQDELCMARLERVSSGCVRLIDAHTVDCALCKQQYTLHRPYNLCRAIRHLKSKHAERMPEYNRGA